jgi:hypothetical protein
MTENRMSVYDNGIYDKRYETMYITAAELRAKYMQQVLVGWQCPLCKVVYSPSVERCVCQATEAGKLGLTSEQL